MSKGNYFDFRKAVAQRESSGNFQAKNQFGYLGAYQFGRDRLADFGITGADGKFSGPVSESVFLASESLQNIVFRVHVMSLQKEIRRSLESGLIGMAHLGGLGNVRRLLLADEVFKDGNGTPITEYFKLFEGYDLDEP